jgi:hypothetical protein|tara:strand:+ start:285 stop:425 length:141 start_codon:yes stop_codon:yes gene_type:complete
VNEHLRQQPVQDIQAGPWQGAEIFFYGLNGKLLMMQADASDQPKAD